MSGLSSSTPMVHGFHYTPNPLEEKLRKSLKFKTTFFKTHSIILTGIGQVISLKGRIDVDR